MSKSVLAFCISDKFSGGERYTLELLFALNSLGWQCTVVGYQNESLASAAEDRGIRYIDSQLGPKLGKRTALNLLFSWFRRKHEFEDLILAEPANVVLLQYKLEQLLWGGRGGVVALLEHGPIPRWIGRIPPLRRRYGAAVRNARYRFAASEPGRAALRAWGAESTVLPAGVDAKRIAQARSSKPRAALAGSIAMDRRSVGIYAGRLTYAKGVVRVANAIARQDDLGLIVIGEGEAENDVKRIAAESSNVEFLGHVADTLPYIAAADFGILCTEDPGEGRPLFVLECIASGVPVVGLNTSSAMRALKQEFPAWIELVEGVTASEISRAKSKLTRFEPPVLAWSDAARTFDQTISSMGAYEHHT